MLAAALANESELKQTQSMETTYEPEALTLISAQKWQEKPRREALPPGKREILKIYKTVPFSGPFLTSLAVGCSWDNFNFTLLERHPEGYWDIFDIFSGETDVDHSVCVNCIIF